MEKVKIDFKRILQFAKLASLVYESDSQILKKCGKNVKIFTLPETDVKCFIQTNNRTKKQRISVRGTANTENVFKDIKYWKTYNKKLSIYIHKGFNESAVEVYNTIIKSLKKDYEIIVTGHSLGAAIATILLMMLKEDGFKLGESIVFGGPKITNKRGANKYRNLLLLRVVHDNDPVPLLPPLTLFSALNFGPYRHFCAEIILYDGDSFEFIDKEKAEHIAISSFWLHILHEEIADHFIKKYIDSLKEKI